MDRHEQFMKHHIAEIGPLLRRALDNSPHILNELIKSVNDAIGGSDDLKKYSGILKELRTILCSLYQIKCTGKKDFNHILKFTDIKVSLTQDRLYTKLNDKDFQCWDELYLILDILVLHMALTYKGSDIVKVFEELEDNMHQHLMDDHELHILDVKLMDCYMDTLLLYKKYTYSEGEPDAHDVYVEEEFFDDKLDTKHLENGLLEDIELELTVKDNKPKLLFQCLPKLIEIIDVSQILPRVWEIMFTSENDSGDALSMLCSTADVWFPTESKDDNKLIDKLIGRSMDERLWLLLLKGLTSLIPQQRKQALQLVRRIVDFLGEHRTRTVQFYSYQNIRPLVCIGNDSQQKLFKKNLNNFFSVLEALERDEEHLATPGFLLLKNLLNETFHIHGFHIAWIRCAYSRILQDDNNAIVKWGLQEVLTLDLELYNEEFLSIVLDVLNNTHFYENDVTEEEPALVKELTAFLNCAETKNTGLVTRFIVQVSKIIWNPNALFYVTRALSMVTKVESVWKEVELEAVKSLAVINSTTQCHIHRIGTQIHLLEAITHFATEPLNLITVANTLSVFPTSEALTRGELEWTQISAWLAKAVQEDGAVSFLGKICEQMTDDNSPKDLSIKSFSLLIMLLHDGQLLLQSQMCPGFAVLRNLLDCSIGVNSKSSANAQLKIRSIELLSYLLEFTTSKDITLLHLIWNYADAILRLAFRNLRKSFDEASFDNMCTYVRITKQLFEAENFVIVETDKSREELLHIERFEVESCNIIEDAELSNIVQRFFGIDILHACLKATTIAEQRNYKFIRSLHETYKNLIIQPSEHGEEANKSCKEGESLKDKIASGYYKIVAELFHEYLKDEPVEEWLPNVNWISEVSYLIQVGGKDIFAPLIGILSQIFYKGTIGEVNVDAFKSALKLCWKSVLESNEFQSATEKMVGLIFSAPFLEREEMKELIIECTREMLDKGVEIPGLSIILFNGLEQVEGEYRFRFYEAILTCLLGGAVPCCVDKIDSQAHSWAVIWHFQEGRYANFVENITDNTHNAVRARAVILLCKMITDDPIHAAKLLPLIVAKMIVNQQQTGQALEDSEVNRVQNRILQVLLLLQPMLEIDDVEAVHALLCNNLLSANSWPNSVRMMQEWSLIRIYIGNKKDVRDKIWDVFDEVEEKHMDGLCSVISIVYHVARSLSSNLQQSFINSAFQHIMPCCMSHELNLRSHSQVMLSKLYDLASAHSYSTITEKYEEFYNALTKSLEGGHPSSYYTEDDFYFNASDPNDDYSLETIFYELPRLSKGPLGESIPLQMFKKFGFKESNSHPLKLLNVTNDLSEVSVPGKSVH